jgi:uncharacterized protein involved in exopolysaccharide biosynthesis
MSFKSRNRCFNAHVIAIGYREKYKMKFMQLLRILRAHTGLIALVLSCVMLVATVVTVSMTPRYVSTSSILIDSADARANATPNSPTQPYSSFLATQIDLIASQTVALKVIDHLHIVDDARARARFLGAESPMATELRGLKDKVKSSFAKLRGDPAPETDAGPQEQSNERFRIADQLLRKTMARPSPDSNVLQVSFSASTPRAAAEGANAFVQAYIDTTLELNVNPARASSAWLDSQVESLTKNVQQARANFSDYQQRSGIVGVGTGDDDETARLTDLNAQLVAAQSQNHPAIQALKNDLARAQAKLNDLPPQLGPNHPSYLRAQSEVSALQAHLEKESGELAQGLRREIAAQKEAMLHMKREHSKLADLKDVIDNGQRALDDAVQRATQARMNSQVTQTHISVVRVAVPPRQPMVPNPLFNFSLALFIGAALAIGLALWREVVCRFVRSADDLRDFLGVQVLGVLHAGPRSSSGRARLPRRHSPLLAMNR